MRAGSDVAALIVMLGVLVGCRSSGADPTGQGPDGGASPSSYASTLAAAVEVASEPYPRAAWRLSETPPRSMVIAASHILIAFKGAKHGSAWSLFVSRGSERSIEDATQVALGLAHQSFEKPERFAEFAAKWSDDVTTGQLGGTLGIFRGDQIPEELLDALAATPPTMIAERVLRTPFGFHVLRRDAPPPRGRLSLARLLLSFEGSPASWELRRRSSRSLAEARALAASLVQQLGDNPDAFARLVREYSDGAEALRDGGLGAFDEYARMAYPARRAVARELVRGGKPVVVQTELGLELIVRMPAGELQRYAASQILIGDVGTPESLLCRAANRTREDAGALAKGAVALAKGNHRFESISKEYCDGCNCAGFEWEAGQADPRIEAALRNAQPGQVVGPVETPIGYVVLRREKSSAAPATEPAPEALHIGIPKPKLTSVEHYVTLVDGETLAEQARRTGQHILAAMGAQLAVNEREGVTKAYEKLATDWASPLGRSAKGRHEALSAWRKQIVTTIGAEKAQALMKQSSEWAMRSARTGR